MIDPFGAPAAAAEAVASRADLYPDPALAARTRDEDDCLVTLAEAASAVIVTGDADLLDAELSPAAITPRTLLATIGWSPRVMSVGLP